MIDGWTTFARCCRRRTDLNVAQNIRVSDVWPCDSMPISTVISSPTIAPARALQDTTLRETFFSGQALD
jgi:hypothetical protein